MIKINNEKKLPELNSICEEIKEIVLFLNHMKEEFFEMKQQVVNSDYLEMWLCSINQCEEILVTILDSESRLCQLLDKLFQLQKIYSTKRIEMTVSDLDMLKCEIIKIEELILKIQFSQELYYEAQPLEQKYSVEFDGIHIKIISKRFPIMWFDMNEEERVYIFEKLISQFWELPNFLNDRIECFTYLAHIMLNDLQCSYDYHVNIVRKLIK